MLQSQKIEIIENNGTFQTRARIYSQKRTIKIHKYNPTWHLKSPNLEIWSGESCQKEVFFENIFGLHMAWKILVANGPNRDLLRRYLFLWLAGGKQLDSMEFRGRVWGGPQKTRGREKPPLQNVFFWAIYLGHHNSHIWRGCPRAHLAALGFEKKNGWSLGDFVW